MVFHVRTSEKNNMMFSHQWLPTFKEVLPGGILQIYYERRLENRFTEFSSSEPKLENFSVAGKIHTVKIKQESYTEKKTKNKKNYSKTELVHKPDIEHMLKLGSTEYHDFLNFLTTIEDLMKLPAVSQPRMNYEEQEVFLEIVDNFGGKNH